MVFGRSNKESSALRGPFSLRADARLKAPSPRADFTTAQEQSALMLGALQPASTSTGQLFLVGHFHVMGHENGKHKEITDR